MAVAIKKPGTVTTVTKHPQGSEVEQVEEISSVPFQGPAAEVEVQASFTKNLGNYQSVRVAVHVRLPCPPSLIDPTFAKVSAFVNEKMEVLIAGIEQES